MFKYIVNELPLDEGFTFITQDEVEGDISPPPSVILIKTLSSKDNVCFFHTECFMN
jgi:hypothetical protein